LAIKTKLPIHVADDPLRAVVRGTGEILKNIEKYRAVIIQ
jgi:rod shape-determining protein MreB